MQNMLRSDVLKQKAKTLTSGISESASWTALRIDGAIIMEEDKDISRESVKVVESVKGILFRQTISVVR